jgi:beta-lactamase class A
VIVGRCIAALLLTLAAPAAIAQPVAARAPTVTPAARSAFDRAADALPDGLAGRTAAERVFAPMFLAAISPAQIAALAQQLREQNGEPQGEDSRTASPDGQTGRVVLRYQRALVHLSLAADTDGRIIGLRITNVATIGDSVAALSADIARLPGVSAWGLYRIEADGRATAIAGEHRDASLAVGSSFKLAILGALDEDIRAGRRRWADTVPLDRQTFPGGTLSRWADGAPMTLHSLAALMISESDNRAADVLLHRLGRERVETFARAHGGLSGANAFPLLSTLEAAVLKNPAQAQARQIWLSGDEAARRALLAGVAARWTPADISMAAFAAGPADIDRIEWFATPDSIARLLGWFARSGSREANLILAINPGIASGAAEQWDYLGYKGGSEPGVMAMNLLLRRGDAIYAASFAWNNTSATLDEPRFVALVTRAAALLRAQADAR